MAFVMAALVDNIVGDRLGGMSSDSTKNFLISEHVYGVYSTYIYINVHAGACTHVYTHTHTHTTPLFRASCHWGIIYPRNVPPTPTKSSTGLPCSDRSPVQVTHPNPPAGIWATAAFLKALWAPAVCEGKGLQRAAMSNWCPRSSARGPGLSGRRQQSGKDRAPGGESRFLSIWTTAEGRRASAHKSLPLNSPLSQTQEFFQTQCYCTLNRPQHSAHTPWSVFLLYALSALLSR